MNETEAAIFVAVDRGHVFPRPVHLAEPCLFLDMILIKRHTRQAFIEVLEQQHGHGERDDDQDPDGWKMRELSTPRQHQKPEAQRL